MIMDFIDGVEYNHISATHDTAQERYECEIQDMVKDISLVRSILIRMTVDEGFEAAFDYPLLIFSTVSPPAACP